MTDLGFLNLTGPEHPFEEIRRRIAAAVDDGRLPVGTRLPPVRTLAADLGVAVNTVARAYKELEAAGVVATRGRAGTVVQAGVGDQRARLAAAADRYADAVVQSGFDDGTAVEYLRAALARRR
ncbi:GntR family transcriptional regulator [Zhihengliuella sp.]|uniref:GntR family transcriptional regulator n=1 Tax=Zhihengliuella sp. TaxID=1954483 RepID=UPI002811F7D6|nr:GntR family transcriptional regulator [Zhihengliuella sp.]